MKIAILAPALMFLALAGCRQSQSPGNSAASAASTQDDYLKRINALPQKQRDTVFYRAIDDAGFECQGVKASEARPAVRGYPAWVAHCIDGRDWIVILEKNGLVQVATPAQLRGEPASAPRSADAAGNETGK